MEFRQLQYFVEVARQEHLTRAADSLHVAQSAISRQISQLEDELGVSLFVRVGKGIKLSQFGFHFLPHARDILRQVESAMETARSYQNPETGTIHLGFPHSMGIVYVPQLVSDFRRDFPRVQFVFTEAPVQMLLEKVRSGELDVAIVTPWSSESPVDSFASADAQVVNTSIPGEGIHLFDEPLCAILPVDHQLASHPSVSMASLAREQFVLFKEGYTLHDKVWRACEIAGFAPFVAFEGEETDTIRGFVRAGLGVSVLPKSDFEHPGIVQIPIFEGREPLLRSIGLTWMPTRHPSAALQGFVGYTRSRAWS